MLFTIIIVYTLYSKGVRPVKIYVALYIVMVISALVLTHPLVVSKPYIARWSSNGSESVAHTATRYHLYCRGH